MTSQLREYTVRPGEMRQWIEEWRSKIVPLRPRFTTMSLSSQTVVSSVVIVSNATSLYSLGPGRGG